MAVEIVTFEELDREHREERLRDAERLNRGVVSPETLQEENSCLPMDAKITFDLVGFFQKTYPPNER